jgi:hypothetical protein
VILVVLLLIKETVLFAQPPINPDPAPITGGFIFLMLGGLVLGVFNLKKKKN